MILTERVEPDVHSSLEEIVHAASHAIGIVLALLALIFLVAKAAALGGAREIAAVSIFAVSALVLYASSTLYHGAFRSRFQPFLETIDHSAIYIKIAGSYTPFALLVLSPISGTTILIIVWLLAIAGITLKFLARYLTDMRKYDWLSLTGGSIGIGMPFATGAAIACPDRKVICLEGDGSGMYTLQALWTQAREKCDVVNVIFANRTYEILKGELMNVGAENPGRKAFDMLEIGRPDLDWRKLAEGMGVSATRATTADEFNEQFKRALNEPGPHLIEAWM